MIKDTIVNGPQNAPHRSLYHALGLTHEEQQRPLIGIVSSYNEIVPGHMNLDKIVEAVKMGVAMAGGTPIVFPAIAVCDGIAMGHEGMKYSLVTRDLIADSTEAMVKAHGFDGLVMVPNCDKNVPGLLMAAARVNIPTIFVSGGPMLAGRVKGKKTSLSSMFEAVGAYQAGKIDEEKLTEYELKTVKNRFGQTKLEAMAEYGLVPNLEKAKRKPGSIKNFVELHVEQGPVLDRENTEIGLISYLAGIGRYTFKFYGKTADSTAPMDTRKDALVAASNFIVRFDEEIKKIGNEVTGMVGKLDITPNSNQFVPELVEGKIEIRTFSKEITTKINFKQLIVKLLEETSAKYDLEYDLQEITRINYPNPTGPSVMCAKNVKIMEDICDELGYSHMIINNGTGHDSMIMTDFTDTNMIYVPSRNNGVSHCPQEWTDYSDIKKGADVLLHLIMKISKQEN